MGPGRFERPTSRLSAVRILLLLEDPTRLSYGPPIPIECGHPCLKSFLAPIGLFYAWHHNKLNWAGRSGVDRYLGMVEASGSNPDRSM